MDRFREPVATMVHNLKPSRRRLRKSEPKTKSVSSKRSSQGSNASSIESGLRSVNRHMGAVGHVALPIPPDLSDSKWLEYVQQHGLASPTDPPREREPSVAVSPPPPEPLIPEFSHLAISDTSPRPSLEPPSTSLPISRHSTMSIMRRQAKTPVSKIGQLEKAALRRQSKTPVFRIGQLEKSAVRRRKAQTMAVAGKAAVAEKPCSVELIAEQYRALLESRDAADAESIPATSPLSPTHLEPSYGYLGSARYDSDAPPKSVSLELPPLSNQFALSPTSDDGTLVAFEEDAIYFKPVSFSPEPSPPPHHQNFDRNSSVLSPAKSSLGLEISLDLLTRELSPALTDRRGKRSRDASSLQIWVMIEAYERLREQVSNMGLDNTELRTLKTVFDSWLGVLYKIHGSMTNTNAASDSEYEALAEELD